jgi:hypothetical protein
VRARAFLLYNKTLHDFNMLLKIIDYDGKGRGVSNEGTLRTSERGVEKR